MRKTKLSLGVLSLLAVSLSSREAMAGQFFGDNLDIPYIRPILGVEFMRVGVADLRLATDNGTGYSDWQQGMAYGVMGGVRLGPISLGVNFQRTQLSDVDISTNKVYAHLGINAKISMVNIIPHFDFGYAFMSGGGETISGFGGKIGLAVDVHPIKLLSIGAGVSIDAAGYSAQDTFVGAVGGSILGRVGIHL